VYVRPAPQIARGCTSVWDSLSEWRAIGGFVDAFSFGEYAKISDPLVWIADHAFQ
jgi:hypothetical protein